MKKKIVLVTGASRGIGRSIALAFAADGYDVAITCRRDLEGLDKTCKEIEEKGVFCLPFIGDMGDFDAVSSLFDQLEKGPGMPDVLVNNASVSVVGLFQELAPAQWQEVLASNVTSVYNCCHFCLPAMIGRQQGKIINISSVWGLRGASCEVAYSASKGAVNALTMALARETAPSNIQVNAIACGAIDTAMNAFLTPMERAALTQEIPAGRLGTPDEAARLAVLLAQAPSYLTGQIISLDGGWQ